MQFTVREAARILRMTDRRLYGLIEDGEVPAQRVLGRYRVGRADLLEWVARTNHPLPPELIGPADPDDPPLPGLGPALAAGGVHHDIEGADKTAVLRAAVARMPLPPETELQTVADILLAREALGSTALGDGIAVPHVRNPMLLRVSSPAVTLCFLRTPVDFGALDGQPVHALFLMVSPTIRAHLHLLARIGTALRDDAFKALIQRHAPGEEILSAVSRLEAAAPTPRTEPA